MKELLKTLGSKVIAPATEAGNLSIGRLMLIVCFGIAVYKWSHNVDIPDTQLTILMTLIGYVLGTKVITGVKDMMVSINETKIAVKSKVGQ